MLCTAALGLQERLCISLTAPSRTGGLMDVVDALKQALQKPRQGDEAKASLQKQLPSTGVPRAPPKPACPRTPIGGVFRDADALRPCRLMGRTRLETA